MKKHFLLSPKFINIERNLKVLPLLLLIHFTQVFHLRRSQKETFLTFASGYTKVDENLSTLHLLCSCDETKVNHKNEKLFYIVLKK